MKNCNSGGVITYQLWKSLECIEIDTLHKKAAMKASTFHNKQIIFVGNNGPSDRKCALM